jgi:hypothetical protein
MIAALMVLLGLVTIALVKLIMWPIDLVNWIHLPLWVTLMGIFLIFSWLIADD